VEVGSGLSLGLGVSVGKGVTLGKIVTLGLDVSLSGTDVDSRLVSGELAVAVAAFPFVSLHPARVGLATNPNVSKMKAYWAI